MNFYKQASEILEKLQNHRGTIKSLTLADNVKEKKKIQGCNQPNNRQFSITFKGKKDGPYKLSILKYEINLRSELARLKIKLKIKDNKDLINPKFLNSIIIPRYVRVNTLKTSVEKVIENFKEKGYKFEENNDDLSNISPKTILKDKHLFDLLILPPNIDLHNHPLYLSGEIILQDKASCFPSFICSPPLNSHVIDACAAPGNKTSHLSAIMQNTGKIWAFDLDKNRLKLLKTLTKKAGCKNIEAIHESFLEANPLDQKYSRVEYILIDPSCSGSGILNRLDHLLDNSSENDQETSENSLKERLENLSEFQKKTILHAFKFPSVKKIVYSTCSIHAQENEHVVKHALEQTDNFILTDEKDIMPEWPKRGIASEIGNDEEAAKRLIRSSPQEYTNGFFVACFIRKSSEKTNIDKNNKAKKSSKKRNKNKIDYNDISNSQENDKKNKSPTTLLERCDKISYLIMSSSPSTPSDSISQEIDFDNIDFDKINFEQIDVNKLDLSDSSVIISLLKPSPKPALSIFPVEIWTHIISHIDDISALSSLNLTCVALKELSIDSLLLKLVDKPPLNKLFEFCKEIVWKEKFNKEKNKNKSELIDKNYDNIVDVDGDNNKFRNDKGKNIEKFDIKKDLKEIIFKMHKYIDKVILSIAGPEKWTDNVLEWVGYDEHKEFTTNQEIFRREVGRIGKAKTKVFAKWEKDVENEKKIMKRELAKVWAISGKIHTENREWKKRRQEKSLNALGDKTLSSSPLKETKESKESKENNTINSSSRSKENNTITSSSRSKENKYGLQSQLRSKPFSSNNHYGNSSSSSSVCTKPKTKRTELKSIRSSSSSSSSLNVNNNNKSNSSKESWKYSHELRNQPLQRRLNTGKEEEEFNRKILTSFVTPEYFSNGETYEGFKNEDLTGYMIKILKRFCGSDKKVLKFPRELTGYQRKRLHRQAEILGLKSISFGEGVGRFLVVMRQEVVIFK
ncbi:280_t:CDS:10 [Diversispora eburnea]|uniref:280_t:CDS:1 n=1 Tax=Diversispora eburnea TaxID=1213867 RepID=A0A9N8VP44_9GLOM|nr:280_t:CDS:10 [Diversispora eburnea]